MAKRIEIAVEMKGIYEFRAKSYGYGFETRYIYNMMDEDGTVYVWKTKLLMHVNDSPQRINKGDKIVIIASVKGESKYDGQPQTELARVKVKERTFKAETWEEKQARIKAEKEQKAQEQRDSLQGEDFIWRMPYRQYKQHYSDCETVVGSYKSAECYGKIPPTIEVIVREGRLKASGVRGEHYSGYRLQNDDGEQIVYRAVKEENAIRRAEKEFGGHWHCIKVYEYQ